MTMKIVDGQPYREVRCPICRNLLADEYIYEGRMIVKCTVCNETVKIVCKHRKKDYLKGGEKDVG